MKNEINRAFTAKKKIFTLVLALMATIATMFATENSRYLLDSIVRVDESTGFVDNKAIYEYHTNGTMSHRINLRASWSSWKIGIPMILNSKTTLDYDEEGNEIDYYWSQLDTATGIWKDTHYYLYDERHNRVCGVRKWNEDSTVVLQGSHYYYDEDNFQIGSDQFDTWNGVQVLDYKCTNAKDAHGNKIIMVEYSKPDGALEGDYQSDPNAFNGAGWIPIDSVYYTYNEKQQKTQETIYRWDKDNQQWITDGYQIFEYDEEGHYIADTVFARDFETNVITYNNMTSRVFDDHGNAIRSQSYIPKFTKEGVEWIDNGTSFADYIYDENGNITQLRSYTEWPEQSSPTTYYVSTYYYSNHAKSEDPTPCLFASGTCGDDLTWELSCDSVLTISGTGAMYDFNWDSPWSAYKDSIKTVIVEEGVTSIGATAFRDHYHLQSCSLPSTLLSIGNEAFCFCFQLISIEIPASCTSFNGYGTFNLVPNVVIQNETLLHESGARSINGYVEGYFVYADETKKSLRACSSAVSGDIVLDDAIERIEYMAFAQCEDITNIHFGSHLEYIGEWSLDGCLALEGIQFQEGLKELATHAFGNCFGLRYVYLPNSLITVGAFAIGNCPDLRTVHLGKSLANIGSQFLDYCQSIDTIYAPMLTPPALDNTVLQSSNIPNIICYVPNQSLSLYRQALLWQEMNLQTIEESEPCLIASGTCGAEGDNLTWELVCDSVLTISGNGEMAEWNSFDGVPWSEYKDIIRTIIIGEGVLSIGQMAFEKCNQVISVTMGNNVIGINAAAFGSCSLLSTIELPFGLSSINGFAFANCSGLTSLTCKAVTPPELGVGYGTSGTLGSRNVFTNVDKSIPLYVPAESVGFYKAADGWNEFTNILPIGELNPDHPTNPGNYRLTLIEPDESIGTVSGAGLYAQGSVVQIEATPNNCYQFVRWSDGVTDNPRLLTLTRDTTISAEWSIVTIASGTCGAQTDNLTWSISCDGILTIGGTGEMADYTSDERAPWYVYADTIESIVVEEGVTTIGECAFMQCEKVQSAILPNSLRSIKRAAFAYTNLILLTIPQGVEKLDHHAFQDCHMLSTIRIPSSVTSISGRAFYNCISVMQFVVDVENAHYRDIDGTLFTKDTTTLICYTRGRSGAYTIPVGVKTIETDAFRHSMQLTSVTIPEGVDTIGHGAFFACQEMTYVSLPSTIVSIGDQSFAHCRALTELTIPQNVAQIYNLAFWDCTGLTKITCLPLNPPTLVGDRPNSIFDDVDKTIPLYVPYTSPANYRTTEPWSYFTTILPIETIVINEEHASNLTIDSHTHIIVEPTGHLYVDDPIEAFALTLLYSNEGHAQVSGITNLKAEIVDIQLSLEATHPANSSPWHAFAVPFEVSVATGIYQVEAANPATCGVDFVLDEYNGILRADTQEGWQRVASNATLYPGKLYMMATNGVREWRLTAANPTVLQEAASVNVEAHLSTIGDHHSGWNGVANTLWHQAKATHEDVNYITLYNNVLGVYEVQPLEEAILTTSQPFFVQVPETGSILFIDHEASHAPSYLRAEKAEKTAYTLLLTHAETTQTAYTDKAYLALAEDKENAYRIGHDLQKIQSSGACVPQLWMETYNTRLAACELSTEEQVLPIGIFAPIEGNYALRLNTTQEAFVLTLLYQGNVVNELSDSNILLYLDKGENTGYSIRIAKSPTSVTGIDETNANANATKLLHDGQILILRGDKVYTVQGQEVR